MTPHETRLPQSLTAVLAKALPPEPDQLPSVRRAELIHEV